MKKVKIDTKIKEEDVITQEPVKAKKGYVLCTIKKENKSSVWLWHSIFKSHFSLDGHTYIPTPDGMYLNEKGIIECTFLEGISTPLSHKNVEKLEVEKIITDPKTNQEKKIKITTIKGLKYDSKIVDIVTNREMSKNLTRTNENDNYIPLIFMFQLIIAVVHSIFLCVLLYKVW